MNNAYIVKFSKLFKDEITLDNLDHSQLVAICKYMGVTPYGNDSMLRFQIYHKLKDIRRDDKEIAWEGVSSMRDDELQAASLMRGMRYDLPRDQLEKQLDQWLELSRRDIPASLMILSRIFVITAKDESEPPESLAAAVVSLPDEVIEETVMDKRISSSDKTLTNEERLEFLLEQEERIKEEEEEEKEKIAEDKVEKQKEKVEQEVAKKQEKMEQKQPKSYSDVEVETPPKDVEEEEPEDLDDTREGITPEKHAEDICRAILVLASKSATELEQEDLEELREGMDFSKGRLSSLDDPMASRGQKKRTVGDDAEVNSNVAFVEKLLDNIDRDIIKVDAKVGSAMKRIDADDDGVISVGELRQAILLLKEHPDQEMVEKMFHLFDGDRDGQINLSDVDDVLCRLEEGEKTDGILADMREKQKRGEAASK